MSLYIQILKTKKLTVEKSNTKSPYGTDNKESGGEVVASLNQQNYYKFAAYATNNLTDDVAHKQKCNTQYYITAIW